MFRLFGSFILLLIVYALISDVIGIVKNVSSTMTIRRKSDNESIPKRDITIADDT